MATRVGDPCTMAGCHRPVKYTTTGWCSTHYERWRKSTPPEQRRRPSVEERFWSYVDKSGGPSACWEWTGARRNGYGILLVSGSAASCHRMSLEMAGEKPFPRADACHRCDNRGCVNPAHLYFGTRQQNIDDAVNRKRIPLGEQKTMSKLTEGQVVTLRQMCARGDLFRDVAARFGVHFSTVAAIAYGKKWKHVGGPIITNRRNKNG